MSNPNDNSLLGFLKKKSLFTNSPTKSRRRSRSKSRDSKGFDQRSNFNAFDERSIEDPIQASRGKNMLYQEEYAQRQEHQQSKTYAPFTDTSIRNYHTMAPIAPETRTHQPVNLFESEARLIEERSQNHNYRPAEDRSVGNNVWTGLVSHSSSFESARLESTQCLQNLLGKIGGQLSGIHYKIDVFNSKMSKILNNEFKQIRQKISIIFENAFKESDKYIKEYMKLKEQQLAGELFSMREALLKEQEKIEGMKEELKKPQWRKVAGEILSTELETRVEELVRKSSQTEVGQWELGDIGSFRLKTIETQLKEIVRLKA